MNRPVWDSVSGSAAAKKAKQVSPWRKGPNCDTQRARFYFEKYQKKGKEGGKH